MTKLAGRRDFSFTGRRLCNQPYTPAGPILPLQWTELWKAGAQTLSSLIPDAAAHNCSYNLWPIPDAHSPSAFIITAEIGNLHSLQKMSSFFLTFFPNLTALQSMMNIGLSCPFCYKKMRQWLQGGRGACSRFVCDWVLAGHTPYRHTSRSQLAKMQLRGPLP